jgi:hypothetical protein
MLITTSRLRGTCLRTLEEGISRRVQRIVGAVLSLYCGLSGGRVVGRPAGVGGAVDNVCGDTAVGKGLPDEECGRGNEGGELHCGEW